METGAVHGALRLGISHKGIPDETGPGVFCHHHRDPRIDTDHVCVIPILQWIKCVHKPVAAPRSRTILVLDGSQYAHGRLRQKRQRACRGAGHDCPIDRPC